MLMRAACGRWTDRSVNRRSSGAAWGAAISSWQLLARSVAHEGALGVVSGTALDVVYARRLQDGDPGGHVRWALAQFPVPRIAERVLTAYDLDLPNKRGVVLAKGGAVEWIHWMSGTARLLPRLIGQRRHGPLFLTDRRAPARTPTLDICPQTGRARLSYRRAEEL
ncbi:MAG: hypothetical protein ACXV5Q_08115, partial [Frankiaceae bacterium]